MNFFDKDHETLLARDQATAISPIADNPAPSRHGACDTDHASDRVPDHAIARATDHAPDRAIARAAVREVIG